MYICILLRLLGHINIPWLGNRITLNAMLDENPSFNVPSLTRATGFYVFIQSLTPHTHTHAAHDIQQQASLQLRCRENVWLVNVKFSPFCKWFDGWWARAPPLPALALSYCILAAMLKLTPGSSGSLSPAARAKNL